MRDIAILMKKPGIHVLSHIKRGIKVCHKHRTLVLFLMLDACILASGVLLMVLHCSIQGNPLDLTGLSEFVMTALTTFVALFEFFEKRHPKKRRAEDTKETDMEA